MEFVGRFCRDLGGTLGWCRSRLLGRAFGWSPRRRLGLSFCWRYGRFLGGALFLSGSIGGSSSSENNDLTPTPSEPTPTNSDQPTPVEPTPSAPIPVEPSVPTPGTPTDPEPSGPSPLPPTGPAPTQAPILTSPPVDLTPCTENSDCATGVCSNGNVAGTRQTVCCPSGRGVYLSSPIAAYFCTRIIPNGEQCPASDSDGNGLCQSGICLAGANVALGICSSTRRGVGEECAKNADCESQACNLLTKDSTAAGCSGTNGLSFKV